MSGLRVLLAGLAIAVCLVASNVCRAESASLNGGTVSFSYNATTQILSWSYSVTHTGDADGGIFGQAWLYLTDGSGGPYGQRIFDENSNPTTHSDSGTISVAPSQWLRYGVRGVAYGTVGDGIIDASQSALYKQVSAADAPAPKHYITVKIPENKSGGDITYDLRIGGVSKGQYVSHAGDSAHEQNVEVSVGTAVDLYAKIDGIEVDGNTYVHVDGAVLDSPIASGLVPRDGPADGGGPVTPEVVDIPPDTIPTVIGGPQTGPGSKTVWSNAPTQTPGAQTDLLTINAFREGVDKLVARLDGEKVTEAAVPAASSIPFAGDTGKVAGLIAKIPAPPTFDPTIDQVGIWECPIVIPGIDHEFNASLDLTPWHSQITICRNFLLGGLAIAFFLVTVRTLREAVA